MKLRTIKNALEFYAQSEHCENKADVLEAIVECSELIKRDVDEYDTVHIVSNNNMIDLLNVSTYDEFGKILAKNSEATFYDYAKLVRKDMMFSDLTNETIRPGYEFVFDLWHNNEAVGSNNPDGTFKK